MTPKKHKNHGQKQEPRATEHRALYASSACQKKAAKPQPKKLKASDNKRLTICPTMA